ncbi:MAG: hypothetical protein AAGA29_09045 [Planctomycetota bacterium]
MSKPVSLPTRIARTAAWLAGSPLGWVTVGAAIIACWAIAHALGWRVYTSAFSGTPPAQGARGEWLAMLGLLYAALYFAAVLIAPVLILAGLMRQAVLRLMRSGNAHQT